MTYDIWHMALLNEVVCVCCCLLSLSPLLVYV
jgi:hypothetical protein